ncbi:MAG TPA: RDD family protein [Terriglobales bacterium]|nr:RDD family protein [Terriglobales bacterium]
MACPLCGDQCHCPAPTAGEHVSVLIDPEDYVDTEQKFASSVHDDETLTHDVSDELVSDDEPLGDLEEVVTHAAAASIGSGTPVITPQLEAPTVVQAVATEPPGFYRPPEPPVWRDEVSNRVDAYRAKRGRGRRYDHSSLSLNFDPLAEPESPAPARYAPVRLEVIERAPETNIIEFPKPMPVASVTAAPVPELPLVEELAEPIVETPRILDVPEGAHEPLPQPMAHIQLDEPADPALEYVAASVELPLPVAPMGPRIGAGLIDMLVVLTATALFGMIFMMIAKELPQGRDLGAAALALPGLLWVAYHYAFLVRCGTTVGMQMAQLGLVTFPDDRPVTRAQRRARALAMAVSAMSVWLGFVWAFFDEDRLAWHDRISHTFLANE